MVHDREELSECKTFENVLAKVGAVYKLLNFKGFKTEDNNKVDSWKQCKTKWTIGNIWTSTD